MKCSVSVTFNFEMRAPSTYEFQDVEAAQPHTIAMRAVRAAKQRCGPVGWTSLVVVLQREP